MESLDKCNFFALMIHIYTEFCSFGQITESRSISYLSLMYNSLNILHTIQWIFSCLFIKKQKVVDLKFLEYVFDFSRQKH